MLEREIKNLQLEIIGNLNIEEFEKKILLVLNILSIEILINNKISKISIGAWSSISGWSYTRYKFEQPVIHNSIQKIYSFVQKYNDSILIEEIEVPYIHDINGWVAYFAKSHKQLLLNG